MLLYECFFIFSIHFVFHMLSISLSIFLLILSHFLKTSYDGWWKLVRSAGDPKQARLNRFNRWTSFFAYQPINPFPFFLYNKKNMTVAYVSYYIFKKKRKNYWRWYWWCSHFFGCSLTNAHSSVYYSI